ncbi:MAG: NUDIX hydrolase [Atopobiaceae bacterium]|nr:NUDIX hydrolase [Atopobiaceae bacterium]
MSSPKQNAADIAEKVIAVHKIWQGRIFGVELLEVSLPDGSSAQREIVRHRGGVGVVAQDEQGRICLVRQWRVAFEKETLEIPAGKLEQGEDPEAAARRELFEETGLVAHRCAHLVDLAGSPGFTNELTRLYVVHDLEYASPHPDEGEFVECEWFGVQELVEMVLAGEIYDSKTVAAILAVHAHIV